MKKLESKSLLELILKAIDACAKDELFKKWNIQVDGRFMYYEYSFKQALENVDKYRTYGAWELLFEDWTDSRWGKYMSKYFIPTFQPRLNKQREELENK